jgi:hypothetical protein
MSGRRSFQGHSLKWPLATIVLQLARKIVPKPKSYSELT